MIGITAYSAYIPRLRLEREKIAAAWGSSQVAGSIAVANYDEDALTMAIEAASACLDRVDAGNLDGVYFASTSAPYREKQLASVVATACDLPRQSQSADFSGSTRAGLGAVISASFAVRSGARQQILVAAADARLAAPESELEGLLGAGAAAVCIGRGQVAAEIVDVASVSEEFTHLWRTDGERYVQSFAGKFSNTYGYNKDLGEALRNLMQANNLEPRAIARLALASPDIRAAADLAKELGFDAKTQLVAPPIGAMGSAGTADPLLSLGAALDTADAGQLILVGAHGEGADAILLRVTDEIQRCRPRRSYAHHLAAKLSLPSYERYLKYRRILDLDEPGEAINNVLEFKELKQDVRLYGSRCSACGTIQYPLARVCLKCRARDSLGDVKLNRTGTVFTFTIDHLIANLEHPLPMAVVDLDGGGRLYLQVTDFREEEVQVGNPVVLTYRRLHGGGGNHNYFWKARPVR
jgi:3-hydroxy-3-methylglutaryl CoA synthase